MNYIKNKIINLDLRIFGSSDMFTQGYIAISSILVIAAVVLVIGTTVALVSINEGQISLASFQNDSVLDAVEGCTEDTLLYLNENNSLPATVVTPQLTCNVSGSQAGSNWTFTVAGTVSGYTKSIQIQAARTTTISITSWNEI